MKLRISVSAVDVKTLLKATTLRDFKTELNALQEQINELPAAKQQQTALRLKKAVDTAERAGKIQMTPRMSQLLNSLVNSHLVDEIDDAEAARRSGRGVGNTVPKMTNLPAVLNKQIAGTREPEWHQVKNLPGYLQSGIRAMGRKVFKPFTDVPIEDIQVLACFDGQQQPNTEQELALVGGWLKRNAVRNREAELKFESVLPGYSAKVVIYSALGYDFMCVKDFAGTYIYSYTSSALENKSRKQLKGD